MAAGAVATGNMKAQQQVMTDESTVGKGKKIVVTVCVELHANWSQ